MRFIKITGTYTLANGVFLFLGYSMLDENVLKKHTKLSVKDVVAALQELISPENNHHLFYPEDEEDASLDDLRNLNAVSQIFHNLNAVSQFFLNLNVVGKIVLVGKKLYRM